MNRKHLWQLHRMKRTRLDGSERFVWIARRFDTFGKRYGETIGDVNEIGVKTARDRIRSMNEKLVKGEVPIDKPEKMTLAEVESFYVQDVRGILSAGSILNAHHAFAWAIKVIGRDTQLMAVQPHHTSAIRNRMTDDGCEPPTIHKTLGYLRAAWNRMRKHNLVIANPFAKFESPKGATRAKEAIIRTRDEIARIKRGAPDAWWRAIIGLWFTGLCEEEALSLKWSDVDMLVGTVTIRRCDAGEFEVGGTKYPVLAWTAKTENRYRTVSIGADTMTALRELHKATDGSVYAFLSLARLNVVKARMDAGKWRADSELVNNIGRDWRFLQRRVLGTDAKRCTIHDCRKSFATNALAAGMLPNEVADAIGDTVEVVMRFYAKARPDVADRIRALTDDGPALKLAG